MAKPNRIKNPAAAPVPQSRQEAADAIAEIGDLSRRITRIETAMNDELSAVKERHERDAAPLVARIKALTDAVQVWCEANRAQLTQNGKVKTATLPTGEIAWRTRPPSCRISGAEAVLDALRRLGLHRFIRVKEEVNKEAILNEPEAVAQVPGIHISQGEDFIVTPFEAELAGV